VVDPKVEEEEMLLDMVEALEDPEVVLGEEEAALEEEMVGELIFQDMEVVQGVNPEVGQEVTLVEEDQVDQGVQVDNLDMEETLEEDLGLGQEEVPVVEEDQVDSQDIVVEVDPLEDQEVSEENLMVFPHMGENENTVADDSNKSAKPLL